MTSGVLVTPCCATLAPLSLFYAGGTSYLGGVASPHRVLLMTSPSCLWLNAHSIIWYLWQLISCRNLCSGISAPPTQQLMTSLGLPHPFSTASPPNPPPLPAVPACNPDLISSYLSHRFETSCPNLCWVSFFGTSHCLAEPTPCNAHHHWNFFCLPQDFQGLEHSYP